MGLQFIINQLSPDEEIIELSNIFKSMDQDHNGVLSRDEMYNAYLKISNAVEARKKVDDMFLKVDSNENGSIDYNEFLMATIKEKKILNEQTIKKAFNALDNVCIIRIMMERYLRMR